MVGVGCLGAGVFKGKLDAGEQGGAVELKAVKRACFDKGFNGALVQAIAFNAVAKVKQAGKGTTFGSGSDDGVDGFFARAFDSA